ncbi:MAG: hypothetical protein CSA53_01960 [Gammaproteobacteria bacterium]|nr:MAG: hypothetical protein CSA53_01960 [Gammaproteobacteria bacterium]
MCEQASEIRAAAINLLARRDYSLFELNRRLSKRFDAPDLIEQQLQRLAEEGWQSDARFAEVFVRAQVAKLRGPVRIRAEMRQRGVSPALIERSLEQADTDWFALIQTLNARKFGSDYPKDPKDRAKRLRFFQYRGFGQEHINSVLPY